MKCDEYTAYKEFMMKYPPDSRERVFLAGMVEAYWEIKNHFGRPLDEIKAICSDKETLDKMIDAVQRKTGENQ